MAFTQFCMPQSASGDDRCQAADTAGSGSLKKHVARRRIADPIAYYREHYAGVTRGELRLRDAALYFRLRRTGVLHLVPGRSDPFGGDPLGYYRTHFPGLTRGALVRAKPRLYHRLRDDGLLQFVPTRYPRIDDPVAHYHAHYAGLTRGQLQKKDARLYYRLWNDRLLDKIPTKRSLRSEPPPAPGAWLEAGANVTQP